MNADSLVSRVRDWLNSRLSHRNICVHLRSSAAKIPSSLITQPQPDATRQGPDPTHPHPAAPGAAAPFKPSRTDPLNREPPAAFASPRIEPANHKPTVPYESSRTDPLNREPPAAFASPRITPANPKPTVPFESSRTDPLNREPPAAFASPPPPPKPTVPPARPARRAPATRAATPISGRAQAAIAEQECMRLARCLDVKPREAPKSLLLRDLCALCASVLNPCFLAGLPAEPESARKTGLRVRANPPPRPVSPNPAMPLKPTRTDPLNRERPVGAWPVATRQASQTVSKCDYPVGRQVHHSECTELQATTTGRDILRSGGGPAGSGKHTCRQVAGRDSRPREAARHHHPRPALTQTQGRGTTRRTFSPRINSSHTIVG